MQARTVLLIADQGLGWKEVREALDSLPETRVVGVATTAAEAEAQARAQRPMFIVATGELDEEPIWPLLAAIVQDASPRSKVIVFAHDCSPAAFFAGIERWLVGYLIRAQLTGRKLAQSLDLLLSGGIVLGSAPAVAAFAAALGGIVAPVADAPATTSRQRAILRALADGMTEQQVARQIGQSVGTVGREITALKDAFGAETLPALLVAAMRAGIIR